MQKRLFLIVVCLCCATALSFGGIYAKYTFGGKSHGVAGSLDFYFSSNLLTTSSAEYTYNPGTTGINIQLSNFLDVTRVASDSLKVELVITSEVGNQTFSGVGTKTTTVLIERTAVDGTNTVDVAIDNISDGDKFTVTATVTMPKGTTVQGYKQVVSATFTVKKHEKVIYKNTNTSDGYVIFLTVWTEDLSGDVTIKFPNSLIPDNTCEGMESVKTTDGSFTISGFGKNSSRLFRFFKTSSYAGEQFIVTLDDGSIHEAIESSLS